MSIIILKKIFNGSLQTTRQGLITMSLVFVSLISLSESYGQAAQQTTSVAAKDFSVKFRSRGIFDLGYVSNAPDSKRLYPYVSDLRVGFKAQYDRWSMRMDIGLSGTSVGVRDAIFTYDFSGGNSITFGNAFEPFSMDLIAASVDLRFNSSASVSQVIANGRRLGVTYYIRQGDYFGAVGLYTDNNFNDLFVPSKTSSAVALTTRQLYRSQNKLNGNLIQVGGAVSFRTIDDNANYANAGMVDIASYGVSYITGRNIIYAKIDNSKYNLKANIELLSMINRFMIQAEFQGMDVMRDNDAKDYYAYGGYVQLSYLLGKSAKYGYDAEVAVASRPSAKSFELSARVDYVNANDSKAKVWGGEHTDVSLGVNYFFNRNFAAKFNVNYTVVGDGYSKESQGKNFVSSFLRLQYVF